MQLLRNYTLQQSGEYSLHNLTKSGLVQLILQDRCALYQEIFREQYCLICQHFFSKFGPAIYNALIESFQFSERDPHEESGIVTLVALWIDTIKNKNQRACQRGPIGPRLVSQAAKYARIFETRTGQILAYLGLLPSYSDPTLIPSLCHYSILIIVVFLLWVLNR